MHNFNSVRHYLRLVRQQKVNYKAKRQVRILMKTLKNGCRYISDLISSTNVSIVFISLSIITFHSPFSNFIY